MKEIIEKLKEIHRTHRLADGDVSAHTKSAQKITKEWQKKIVSDLIEIEVDVSPKTNEKIDVIDISAGVAYELKVSGKNAHHEFYKDIAKVLTYNEYQSSKLKKLIFISEQAGIAALRSRLDARFLALMARVHKLDIELLGI
jgi:hypothetical protein